MTELRRPLTDEDVDRIATAVAEKAAGSFHLGEEAHYNSHKKLDQLLGVYESAHSAFWKAFIAFVIIGSIVLAGLGLKKF